MKKASDIRSLTIEELKQEETTMRKELFNLRFQQVTGDIQNPLRIRHVRRNIAKVLTIVNEKSKASHKLK